jgi:hypothetical protein
MTVILLFVALATMQDATVAANSDISVKDIGNSQYELTLHTTTTVNIFEAQRELAPTAKRTCRNKEMHFGHYAFATREPLSATATKGTTLTLT